MSVPSNHHASSPLCSGNKSKKSKSDILRTAVGMYLKQKNFVASNIKEQSLRGVNYFLLFSFLKCYYREVKNFVNLIWYCYKIEKILFCKKCLKTICMAAILLSSLMSCV